MAVGCGLYYTMGRYIAVATELPCMFVRKWQTVHADIPSAEATLHNVVQRTQPIE